MQSPTTKPVTEPLNITAKLEDIQNMYLTSAAAQTLSALLLGPTGSGKTCALVTAPKPLVIDCFDPGGMKSILPDIKKGGIYPTLYEADDYENPYCFQTWIDEFNNRVKTGFFNHISTYAIDSLTYFFVAALMYEKHLGKTAGQTRHRNMPSLDDYRIMSIQVVQVIQKIMTLPCNFILTAHVTKDKDQMTGKFISGINANPKLQQTVPAAFDEVYIMQVNSKAKGDEAYKFLTDNDGMYECRSRLATKLHLLDKNEPANFRYIMKKVGYPYEDKEVV